MPQVGEGAAGPEVGPLPHGGAGGQHRDVLAGMIRARRGRVVAVVGRQDQQVLGQELRQQRRQARVEPLEVLRVPLDVVAMPVLRVEIHEVGEDERALPAAHRLLDAVHPLGVRLRVDRARDPPAGEQVLDLADGDDGAARGDEAVEDGRALRPDREVAAVRGAAKGAGAADERARDHPADPEPFDEQRVGGLALAVQLVDRDDVLVGGDLEHAVGRRVDDWPAGAQVLGPQVLDDDRARGDGVAQRGAADPALELGEAVRGEPVGEDGKWPVEHESHQLPMAGHRVLARRPLDHAAEGRARRRLAGWDGGPARGEDAGRDRAEVREAAEAKGPERGQFQRHARGDVPQRVAALVAVGRRVGQLADADAVEHDDDRAADGRAAHCCWCV